MNRPRISYGPIFVYAFTALFFLLFFALPIWETLGGAFRQNGKFTLDYIIEVFRNPIYLEGLWNSVQMAVYSTTLTAAIALPLALLSDRYLFPGKGLFSALVLIPMILPPFVGAIGVKQILGQEARSTPSSKRSISSIPVIPSIGWARAACSASW